MVAAFVGRRTEMARCVEALDSVLLGRGQLLLFVGEAGIGKTVLADRVARMAEQRGCKVAWGRCWEAGGAPAYWPWSQVFGVLGVPDPFAQAGDATLDAADARFRHFDAACRVLGAIARDAPVVLALDDLHAADLPSLSFLHLLARQLSAMRLLVVGTYRDAQAWQATGAGTLLAKIGREGQIVRLGRLDRDDVMAWISRARPNTTKDVAGEIFARTEGNPLFVREVLQLDDAFVASKIPDTLREVLTEHLRRLTPAARETLSTGAVLGREMRWSDLACVCEAEDDALHGALREAIEAGILEPRPGTDAYAFTHVLLRDRLYAELSPSTRARIHRACASRFRARGDHATAAHHLLEAQGTAPATELASAVREAARDALTRLAFEEAASLTGRALEVLGAPQTTPAGTELACELSILRAEALISSNEDTHGKQLCVAAADLARSIGSTALLARAALAYGSQLTSSAVDPTMVRLLRDALTALDGSKTRSSALRARVMARLAVALTPPQSDDDLAIIDTLAREALALAKQLDDPDTLLFVAYFASNATAGAGFRLSPRERHATIALAVDLARQLHRPAVLIHAAPRWITSLREQGRRTDAMLALDAYAELVRQRPRPHHQWRVPIVRATMAMLDGQLDEAERLGREALAIADAGGVAVGAVGWAMHRIALAQALEDPGSLAAVADRVLAALAPLSSLSSLFAWVLAALGRTAEARVRLHDEARERFSAPKLIAAGETAVSLGDRELAERILLALEPHAAEAPIFWAGPHGCAAFGPVQRVLGDLAALVGRATEARAHYQQAVAIGERMDAPTFVARAQRALTALDTSTGVRPTVAAESRSVMLVHEGDIWTVTSFTGVTVRLQDSKGLRYLARLVAEPDREIHVTELAGTDVRSSDAGPMLDAQAKRAYKRRLEALDDELREAQSLGDPARAERAQAEIDALARELARAIGLGGRDRRAGSVTERARINVQRRIRHAIRQIAEQDPALSRYLNAAVRTGPLCTYRPV